MWLIRKLLTHCSRAVFLVRVSGESMWPAIIPGRRYLATAFQRPRLGDIIVFRNPQNPRETFVKSVESSEAGGWRVCGLVSWATSFRDFGAVPRASVLGVVKPRWRF
jgi:hypothetical protein